MGRKALLTRGLVALLAEFVVFAALLFVPAGTVLWPAGWVFLVIFFGLGLSLVLWLARDDPELLAERLASPLQRGQPLWDKVFWLRQLALHRLADLEALGRHEVRVVGGARLAAIPGSPGTRAVALRRVLNLPGERLSCPSGEAARGAEPERGGYWPLLVREASHVFEHILVLSGDHTPAGLVVGSPAQLGASGSTRLEDRSRRPDAKE